MKKIMLGLVSMLFGFAAAAQNTSELLKDYITVKNALVSSDSEVAGTAASHFYEGVKKEADFALKADLLKARGKLSKAGSIEKQRSAFNDVSTVMWKLGSGADATDQVVYYQYCPMKKAYWLSEEKEIENPYYGASMLNCGNVVERKN